MKQMIPSINRAFVVTAMIGVLLSPVMVGEAMAQTYSSAQMYCINPAAGAKVPSATCVTQSNGSICSDGESVCVPEMSDYLAIAFLVAASGMVYFLRRGALPRMNRETTVME